MRQKSGGVSRAAEHGSAALPALAMAMLLVACVSSIIQLGAARAIPLDALGQRVKAEAALRAIPGRLLELIATDPSPEGDSYYDPLWGFEAPKGIECSITDLSARLDPANLSARFVASLAIPIAPKGRMAASWLNPALADSTRIDEVASLHGAGPLRFALSDEGALDHALLLACLGPSGNGLCPPFSSDAPLNANSAEPAELEAALSAPCIGLSNPRAAFQAILAARARGEIGQEYLALMLEGNSMALELVGSRSWFWRVEARHEGLELLATIARLPGDSGLIVLASEVRACSGSR
jgi:hypothetical protein